MLIEVTDDTDEAEARLADGGVLERRFVQMALDLTHPLPSVPMPAGFSVEPIRADLIGACARVVCAAYVSGHPDHEPEDDDPIAAAQVIAGYMRGDEPGPWIEAASLHAVGPDGAMAALLVASAYDPTGDDPNRPWITELAVDPRWAGRGLGQALVMRAASQLVARGDHVVGLAVTVGNPARRLYEHLGFAITHEVWRISTDVV